MKKIITSTLLILILLFCVGCDDYRQETLSEEKTEKLLNQTVEIFEKDNLKVVYYTYQNDSDNLYIQIDYSKKIYQESDALTIEESKFYKLYENGYLVTYSRILDTEINRVKMDFSDLQLYDFGQKGVRFTKSLKEEHFSQFLIKRIYSPKINFHTYFYTTNVIEFNVSLLKQDGLLENSQNIKWGMIRYDSFKRFEYIFFEITSGEVVESYQVYQK